MNAAMLEQIVHAVLYEGYILYPYRASSKTNDPSRFTFGRVYPQAYHLSQAGAEPCVIQTQCLLECPGPSPVLEVSVRFLHPMWREVRRLQSPVLQGAGSPEPPARVVGELLIGGKVYQSWQEAVEREVTLPPISLEPGRPASVRLPFAFLASRSFEQIVDDTDGVAKGLLRRRQEAVEGVLEFDAFPVGPRVFKVTVRVLNQTPVPQFLLHDPDAIVMRTFASTHTILQAKDAQFISLTDPPNAHKKEAGACINIGTWPVLVGDEQPEERERATMLSSPIILSDYPKIARESRGDFFDVTDIDEMLALRVLTMDEIEPCSDPAV